MRVHVLSDLHLEFDPTEDAEPSEAEPSEAEPFVLPNVDADLLVLAGDIGVGLLGVTHAIQWAKNYRYGAIYVAGNHEYYKQRWPVHITAMRDAARGSKLYVLDRDVAIFEGVRFLGTTLWTDFALYGESTEAHSRLRAGKNMHDYDTIRHIDDRWLNPLDTQREHKASVGWLREQLAMPYEGKTVVVTHHLPSQDSMTPRFRARQDPMNPAYASNLDHLFGDHLAAWVHGHSHYNVDYMRNGTRVVANMRGYPGDTFRANPNYNPTLVIDIP